MFNIQLYMALLYFKVRAEPSSVIYPLTYDERKQYITELYLKSRWTPRFGKQNFKAELQNFKYLFTKRKK